MDSETKRCPCCGETKPRDNFYTHKGAAKQGKPFTRCILCENANTKARYAARSGYGERAARAAALGAQGCKECRRCHEEKPLDAFDLLSESRDGKQPYCKECRATMHRVRASDPSFRAAMRLKGAAYRAANREMVRARGRAESRRARERDPEKVRARYRAWMRANYEKAVANVHMRRARMMNAPVVERIDREAIIERDHATCYLCGKELSRHRRVPHPDALVLDHVVPLRRGGDHAAANLRVACYLCNARKGTRLLVELDWFAGEVT